MYKQKSALFFLLVLFLSFSKLFAQITVSPSSGCLPGGVTNANFSYAGTGNPTNIVWNYGDGSPTTTLTATQHSYLNAGSYTVTFTALINNVTVTYTALVTVNSAPGGNMSASIPGNHCAPMTVGFNGSSTTSNVTYLWAFGDLQSGTGASTSHNYSAGSYTPVVTVQNPVTGCFTTVTGPAIKVSNPPLVYISANPGFQSCASPFVTALDGNGSISNSPTGGGLTYSWNLGPFGSSTQANTGNITFQPLGTYSVTLTVTDNNNCSASATQIVKIETPTVSAVVPPTVCINGQMTVALQVFTATVNSNQPTTTWAMGDGTLLPFPPLGVPPLPTPILTPNTAYTQTIYTYVTPGLKTLTITATAGPCVATITKTIMVEQIVPQFTFTAPSFYCSSSVALTYTDQSTLNTNNTLTYTWSVPGWGSAPTKTSTLANPSFTVSQGSLNVYADYSHPPYVISPKLLVMSQPVGCTASIVHITDTLQRSTSQFAVSKSEGCMPLSVTFSNTSITSWTEAPAPIGSTVTPNPILSYTWNFGGSPSATLAGTTSPPNYTVPPPTYIYTATGVYQPSLTILTALGCTDVSVPDTITVVNKAVMTVTLPPSPTCAGTPVQLLLASPQAIEHWHVATDTGYFSGCVNSASPTWKPNHIGTHDYTISAYYHGCKTDSVFPAALKVIGPTGRFVYETNCNANRKSIKFYYNLDDATSATLDYGDGSPANTIISTANITLSGTNSHVYTIAKDYTVVLKSYNSFNTAYSCGTYSYTDVIHVRDPKADFNFVDSVVCNGGNVALDASSAVDAYSTAPQCALSYIWYVDNFPPKTSAFAMHSPTNNITGVGAHSVKLVVKDINGCKHDTTKTFRVSSPAPNFTFNANPMCLGNQPVIYLNTTSQVPDPILSYTLLTGDSILYPPYTLPPPYHTYTIGANPSLSPSFIFSPSFIYPGLLGGQSLTFTVTLQAMNSYSCVSYTRKTITVNNPLINIQVPRTGCTPTAAALAFSVQAASTHTNYTINWGDGTPTVSIGSYSTNAQYINIHNYATTGTFIPVFTVTDFGGCKASQTISAPPIIIETAPVASFTFFNVADPNHKPGPGPFCAPLSPSVTSTTHSPFDLTYYWNLGDAAGTQASLDSSAFTNYTNAEGIYTISLRAVTRIAGCSSTYSIPVTLLAPHINFLISPDSLKRTYCLNQPIDFSVTTHPGAHYYQWDFGDGAVTNTILVNNFTLKTSYTNTFFPVTTNGVYTVILTGYSDAGTNQTGYTVCKDTKTVQINVVRAFPDFDRNTELLKTDTAHCLGKTDQFKNLSTDNIGSPLSYTWTLGDGKTEYGTDVSHTYVAGTYSVKLDVMEPTYSCTASLTKKMVIFPLPKAQFVVDSFSCPADTFHIAGSGTPGVSGILTGTLLPGPTTLSFSPVNSFSIGTTASVSTTYSLSVTDNNGCKFAAGTKNIFIQQPAPQIHWDTTIIIGQPTPLNAFAGPGFSYTWTPLVTYLNCDTCRMFNPVSTTTTDLTYSVMVEDGHQCSIVANTYKIHVEIKVSLDVPTAFTPNGDGTNDIIFPNGWGLRKLNYFKIFNRWGQLIFESNDLTVGWDGVYQGVPQNMETYVYQVSAETFSDQEPSLSKTGTFKLLR